MIKVHSDFKLKISNTEHIVFATILARLKSDSRKLYQLIRNFRNHQNYVQQITIEAYNKEKHDNAGQPPLPVWVKITGLPYRFFKKNEFERIADDLSGSILLDVDPRNSNHHDFSFLRIKIGIANIEVIPPFRKLKFTEGDDSVSFHTLYYDLDHEANAHGRFTKPRL
jgi:Domain of unknown function (DUF4283)